MNDVAEVDVGYAPRLGAVSMNHRKEVVEGIVLMRKYGSTLDTLAGVKAKVASLNASNIMPPGCHRRLRLADGQGRARGATETGA